MRRGGARPRAALVVSAVAAGLLLAACTPADDDGSAPTAAVSDDADGATPPLPAPTGGEQDPTESSAPAESSTVPENRAAGPERAPVSVEVDVVATGLPAPWAVARLPQPQNTGSGGGLLLLVTLRDEARVVVVDPGTGAVTPVTGPGADELRAQTRPGGEGGLLGVAVAPDDPGAVYLYRTGDDANAVVRADLDLDAAGPRLGALTTVLDGIPRAGNHNGGRLAFGPDGFLYVTTGDAGDRPVAQDPASLGGKILRLTPDGDPAPGNPVEGSPVWSLGHRNVQGIAWDADGHLLASEFGQNTWDELNQILPGGNYGWPDVEGADAGSQPGVPLPGAVVEDGFVRPLMTWRTSDASPSGLAVAGQDAYLASLRGQRLWRVPLTAAKGLVEVSAAQPLLAGEGRLRDVVADPDGSLWVLTNNTDGRGSPRADDDRLLHLVITPE
ncbi:glucose sorbosone dehydrogenase [Xylanimonas cellulosilytica DSM 15894]|uniref:Glucose sorbosone dehydrogenase n=1 Tax=Xylanimonas cellulosilytica (strain DSM 15894 / JCM 12276 / CECT 5975 / KCTC 9989 / LMG 20990 / NBRC 107835 / XIL07) TaxID=446471 RepID=D1BXV5_XYLCX|nr:PQQ-dependent sugar dehydrogenase [Xylanimonas cellulosilytica]ACZ31746.1 glucose sorbosone dehydrogenase [Xylanimonas cellulosilytica DSM 15894]